MEIQFAYDPPLYRDTEQLEAQLGHAWRKRIFEIVVTNVCISVTRNPQSGEAGLKGTQARSFNRVLEALDASQSSHITLDKADAEFLKSMFFSDRAQVAPAQSRVFCLVQDAIEEAFSVGKEG